MSAPPADGFIEQNTRGIISGPDMDGYVSKLIDPRSLDATVEA